MWLFVCWELWVFSPAGCSVCWSSWARCACVGSVGVLGGLGCQQACLFCSGAQGRLEPGQRGTVCMRLDGWAALHHSPGNLPERTGGGTVHVRNPSTCVQQNTGVK